MNFPVFASRCYLWKRLLMFKELPLTFLQCTVYGGKFILFLSDLQPEKLIFFRLKLLKNSKLKIREDQKQQSTTTTTTTTTTKLKCSSFVSNSHPFQNYATRFFSFGLFSSLVEVAKGCLINLFSFS